MFEPTTGRDAVWQTAPRCNFYVRTQVTDQPATYRYESVYTRGGEHGSNGHLATPHPPAVGDLIWLHDENGPHTGSYRVIERAWTHSAHGSANWPYSAAWPSSGPLLDIVVVRDAGPFRDEAPGPEDDEEEA